MAINFDKALGIHPHTMVLRAKRAEVLASNIANADTPGYKAQGMDFKQMLSQAQSKQQMGMAKTHDKHLNASMSLNDGLAYRTPTQPDTGDGNTVDVQLERNLYMENSLEYQASVNFMSGRFRGLNKALKGGQ